MHNEKIPVPLIRPAVSAKRSDDPGACASLEDPIEAAFPIMVDAAQRHCQTATGTTECCYQYHRLWPYTRLIGYRGSVWRYGARFIETFRRLAKTGAARRILISGCADYSLLAHIVHAYRMEGVEPEVTALDVCDAPLAVNRWYAQRYHVNLKTVVDSILEFVSPAPFDVVSTDNFLSQFTVDDRSAVVRRWRNALRPDGYLTATQNVSNDQPQAVKRVSSERIAIKVRSMLEHAKGNEARLGISLEELGRYIEEFYRWRVSYPLSGVDEVTSLLEQGGFALEQLRTLSEEGKRRLRRPDSENPHRDRLHFLARRIDNREV